MDVEDKNVDEKQAQSTMHEPMEISTTGDLPITNCKVGELSQVDQTREPVCNISVDRKTPTKQSEVTLDRAGDVVDKDLDGMQTKVAETMEVSRVLPAKFSNFSIYLTPILGCYRKNT